MTETTAVNSDEQQVAIDLVRRIGAGNSQAETELWERYSKGIYFLLLRRTNDPDMAEDFRSETFRIAIEKLRGSGLDDSGRLAAYLRGIAVNLVLGDIRKHVRRNTWSDTEFIEQASDDQPGVFELVSRDESAVEIRRYIEEMTVPRDRQIIRRYYLDEVDKQTICGELDIDPAHFNRVLFRARQRLKALLQRGIQKSKLKVVK